MIFMIETLAQAIIDSFISFFAVSAPIALVIGLSVVIIRFFIRGVMGRF